MGDSGLLISPQIKCPRATVVGETKNKSTVAHRTPALPPPYYQIASEVGASDRLALDVTPPNVFSK